jgi:hypothetical protein
MTDDEETAGPSLDDLDPGSLKAAVAGALGAFEEIRLPFEAVVVRDGEIDRDAVAQASAARIKSDSLYGESYVAREVRNEDDEEDLWVKVEVLDPTNVTVDEDGEIHRHG